ncbi:unnamed protein product [Pleuronectes platessa]|uniref:Uncharacterized protein n=1 Tax=Pleuronectes platessa TaxID=8262 RepID=A0A9N7UWH2_PLEPL|nr:unnamed protein product [Pleuronectes platessa]
MEAFISCEVAAVTAATLPATRPSPTTLLPIGPPGGSTPEGTQQVSDCIRLQSDFNYWFTNFDCSEATALSLCHQDEWTSCSPFQNNMLHLASLHTHTALHRHTWELPSNHSPSTQLQGYDQVSTHHGITPKEPHLEEKGTPTYTRKLHQSDVPSKTHSPHADSEAVSISVSDYK